MQRQLSAEAIPLRARRSVCCCYGGCVTNNTGRPGRLRQKLPTKEEREFSSVFYICIAFLGCSGWQLLCESNRNRKGKTPNLCGMDEIEIELVVRRYTRWEEMLGARRVFVQLWARERENTCTWSCPNIIESYAKWIYCSVRESLNPLFPVPIRRRRAMNSFEAYVVMHCAPVDLVLRNRLLALAARVEFITLQSRTNWEIIHLRIVGVACLLLVVAWMEWALSWCWMNTVARPLRLMRFVSGKWQWINLGGGDYQKCREHSSLGNPPLKSKTEIVRESEEQS